MSEYIHWREVDCVPNLFNNIPSKPYCANDFAEGVKIRAKAKAIKHRHIQLNTPQVIRYLTFDCDTRLCYRKLIDTGLQPIVVVLNRNNQDKFHATIELSKPVLKFRGASLKPIQYLADIHTALTVLLHADIHYNGLLTKNPYCPEFVIEKWYQDYNEPIKTYTLGELNEIVKDVKTPYRKPTMQQAYIGRNCDTFHFVRELAYQYKRDNGNSGLLEFCLHECTEYTNRTHSTPLHHSELLTISKSIAYWTEHHYTGTNGLSKFTVEQNRKGGINSGATRRDKDKEINDRIQRLRWSAVQEHPYTPMSYDRIATKLGVSKRKVQFVITGQ